MMSYFKNTDAVIPNGVRFLARRCRSLADSVATLFVAGVVFMAAQMGVAPDASPVTFQEVLGQVESLTVEGDKEIPTITLDSEVTYKRLGDDWKEIVTTDDQVSVENVSSTVQAELESVYVNDRAEIADAVGQDIKIATWTPRLK